MNAKRSLSRHRLARDLRLYQKTAWFMMARTRTEMGKKGSVLLKGVIEADETYIGSKRQENRELAKRGCSTQKDTILGAVELGGKVVAQLAIELTGHMIERYNVYCNPSCTYRITATQMPY